MSSTFNNPIFLSDYHYDLPDHRIALHPVSPRDHARLLTYRQGKITHHHFYDLPNLLPSDSLLVFNQTKVIPARIMLQRLTGAKIELLLTSPVEPTDYSQIFSTTQSCIWECMIGNKKRWKLGETLTQEIHHKHFDCTLHVQWESRENNWVRFFWEPHTYSFAEILDAMGTPPLPPYLKREATSEDTLRYQTVYAKEKGAVAAPTAGLHFTTELLDQLQQKGLAQAYLNLHVGIGTFAPIKTESVMDHHMHSENFSVSIETLQQLAEHDASVIAVGTTSMRVLESLYWMGQKLALGTIDTNNPTLNLYQHEPYEMNQQTLVDRKKGLYLLLEFAQKNNLDRIKGATSLYIVPGYRFHMCEGLITNYHQPGSTLILLVAAFIGTDWRKIYHEALKNDYRFLSYGDSSLLLP